MGTGHSGVACFGSDRGLCGGNDFALLSSLTYSPLWGGGKANCLAGAGRHEWPRRLFRRGTWSMGVRWTSRDGLYRGDPSPVVYGPVGISAAAMWRIKVASGQAAAKARRTRDAISITRAPSLKRRRQMV